MKEWRQKKGKQKDGEKKGPKKKNKTIKFNKAQISSMEKKFEEKLDERLEELKKSMKPAAAIGSITADDTGDATIAAAKQSNGMQLTSILKRNNVQISDANISSLGAQA